MSLYDDYKNNSGLSAPVTTPTPVVEAPKNPIQKIFDFFTPKKTEPAPAPKTASGSLYEQYQAEQATPKITTTPGKTPMLQDYFNANFEQVGWAELEKQGLMTPELETMKKNGFAPPSNMAPVTQPTVMPEKYNGLTDEQSQRLNDNIKFANNPPKLDTSLKISAPKIGEWVDTPDMGWTPEETKKALDRAFVHPDPGSPRDLQMKKIAYDTMKAKIDPVSSIFFDTFLPTKVIFALDRDGKLVNEARQTINNEFSSAHPFLSILPIALGEIANLALIGKAGGGFGLAEKTTSVAGRAANWFPNAVRMIGLGAESGSIFGISSALSEALNQAENQKFEPGKLLSETLKGVGTGSTLGVAGGAPKLWQRVLGSAGTLSSLTALQGYMQDGKIDGNDVANIAINGLIGAGFELVGGREKTRIFQTKEEARLGRDVMTAKIASGYKGGETPITWEDAQKELLAMEQLPKMIYDLGREETLKTMMAKHPEMSVQEANKIYDDLTQLPRQLAQGYGAKMYSYYQAIPKDFYAGSIEIQKEYFNSVRTSVIKDGLTIPDAIQTANETFTPKMFYSHPEATTPQEIYAEDQATQEIKNKMLQAKTGQPIELTGWNTSVGQKDSGFRSPDRYESQSYSVNKMQFSKGGEVNVNKTTDKLNNPYVADNQSEVLKFLGNEDLLKKAQDELKNTSSLSSNKPIVIQTDEFIRKELLKQGYDGVIYTNGNRRPEYQVFNVKKTLDTIKPLLANGSLEEITTEVDQRLEEFRKKADLMASNEGAGVRQFQSDQTGGETKIYNYFKLDRAKADMSKQARQLKNYAHELLYENDPVYKELYDKKVDLEEKQLGEATDEIDVQRMFDEISKQEKILNVNVKKYETSKDTPTFAPTEVVEAKSTGETQPNQKEQGTEVKPASETSATTKEEKPTKVDVASLETKLGTLADEIRKNKPTPEKMLELTPSDFAEVWQSDFGYYEENILTPAKAEEATLKEELAKLKGIKTPGAKAQKKELQDSIDKVGQIIAEGDNIITEEGMKYSLALADVAIRYAQKQGLDLGKYTGDPEDGVSPEWASFRDDFLTEISERPYIETNWNDKITGILDDLIGRYKEEFKNGVKTETAIEEEANNIVSSLFGETPAKAEEATLKERKQAPSDLTAADLVNVTTPQEKPQGGQQDLFSFSGLKVVPQDTTFYHGTSQQNATNIKQDGVYQTDDVYATYGRGFYLTDDKAVAQDYADEVDNGQVLEFTAKKELKLLNPTQEERETLIDLTGEAQDDMINQLLGDTYDGFYLNDIGMGDGSPQVVLYNKTAGEINDLIGLTKNNETKRSPSGMASAGTSKIGNFEKQTSISEADTLKLYEEVKQLTQKYAQSVGESHLPRGAAGVLYESGNIRVVGMNALSVATHEITHFLDRAFKISDQILGVKAVTKAGRPVYERNTAKLRNEMTDLYEKYYPTAKKAHKLKKKILEGFAILLEKYIEQPTMISGQYPNLVREFLTPDGSFYEPVIGDLIRDVKDIVARYQKLSPLDKIGARIINDKVNVNKDTFLNFYEKIKTFVFNNIYPIEVLSKKAGTHFTADSPDLWLAQYNNSNSIITSNVFGKKGYWAWRDGVITKIFDFNWKTLVDKMKKEKVDVPFGNYLIARDQYFHYQELAKIKEGIDILEKELEVHDEEVNAKLSELPEMQQKLAKIALSGVDDISLEANLKYLQDKYEKESKILENNGFTEQEVTDAYQAGKSRFEEMEQMHDALTKADLEFLHQPFVQLINDEEFANLITSVGYASMKRAFYDEIAGEEGGVIQVKRPGGVKASSLMHRKGSERAILHPVYSGMMNHAEITRKGLKQVVYNKVGDLAEKFPELMQRLELKVIPDVGGAVHFPQEKDPDIIMARKDYKRSPVLVDKQIKRVIDDVLTFQNVNIFEKLVTSVNRLFVKGTTGLYTPFAIANWTVDQSSATAQSRNKYLPVYDQLTKLAKALNSKNIEHTYAMEYMVAGGERQTFAGHQDASPNELFDLIENDRKGVLKLLDLVNSGFSLLAVPAQYSEISTRMTEYIKARLKGKSSIVALEEAGRVSAPFHHIGSWGGGRFWKTWIKSIPFANATLQVLAQELETLESKEGRKRYLFVMLATIAAAIAGMLYTFSHSTDEQKQLYIDLNPDDLSRYIFLPNPNGKSLIKIRVPQEMVVIGTIINMAIMDKMGNANYTAGEYTNAGTAWLPQQFNVTQPIRMFLSWIPQIIKPAFETIANVRDYPKVLPLENQGQQAKQPENRFTASTSPVAKWLGQQFKMSPIKIDYLFTGYLGRASGMATGKIQNYNPFISMNQDYYFESGRKLQTYYDTKQKNDQLYSDYLNKRVSLSNAEIKAMLTEKSSIKGITALLKTYNSLNPDKQPKTIQIFRDKIIKAINQL